MAIEARAGAPADATVSVGSSAIAPATDWDQKFRHVVVILTAAASRAHRLQSSRLHVAPRDLDLQGRLWRGAGTHVTQHLSFPRAIASHVIASRVI